MELRLISELIKNSHRSDREIARTIKTSQPTVTRTRTRLEKEGIIKEYTIIPDLAKLGVEIVAVTFAHWSPEKISDFSESERIKKAQRFLSKHPNVIYASSGTGLGMGRMMITVHKSYSDYANYIKEAQSEWAGLLSRFDSFIISMRTDVATAPFSFRNLGEYLTQIE